MALKVSIDELAAIGDLTLSWNSVEEHFQWLIWTLAGWNSEVGEAVTTDMGNVSRVQLALNLSNLHLRKRLIEDVSVTMSFMEICRSKRNDIIHALPVTEPNEPRVLRKYSAKSGSGNPKKTDTPIDIEVLNTISHDMTRITLALVAIQSMVKVDRIEKADDPDYPGVELIDFCDQLSLSCITPLRKRLNALRLERQNAGKNPLPLEFSQD